MIFFLWHRTVPLSSLLVRVWAMSSTARDTDSVPDDNVALYSILNVPQDATKDAIKKAYFKLAKILHPDKQRRQIMLAKYSDQEYDMRRVEYQKVMRAWKVLGDPVRREVYDSLGGKGVEMFEQELENDSVSIFEVNENQGLTVYDSPSLRLRKRLRACRLDEEKLAYDKRIQAVGAVQLDVRADDVFDPPQGFPRGDGFFQRVGARAGLLDIAGVVVQQQVSADLSAHDNLSIQGYAVTRMGVGYGAVSLGFRRTFVPGTWAEVGATLGYGAGAKATVSRDLSEHDTVSLTSVWKYEDLSWSRLALSWLRRATDRSHYVFSMDKPASDPARLSLAYNQSMRSATTTAEVVVGGRGPGLSCGIQSFSKDRKVRNKVSAMLGADGVHLILSQGHTLSNKSDFSTNLTFNAMSGTSLSLRFRRGGFRFDVPISLAANSFFHKIFANIMEEGDAAPENDFTFDIFSAIGYIAFGALVEYMMHPRRRKGRMKALKRRAGIAAKLRKSALVQQRMMASEAKKNETKESERSGLVILQARYGKRLEVAAPGEEDGEGDEEEDEEEDMDDDADDERAKGRTAGLYLKPHLDVRAPLQFLVKESSLFLEQGSKRSLLGFANPLLDDTPSLYVKYAFDGIVYESQYDDDEPVLLPSPYASVVKGGPYQPLTRQAQDVLKQRKAALQRKMIQKKQKK